MKTIVAIHQPNFFPWLGYFDKIRQADVFVFLDDVSYPRSGSGGMGSWSNRVKIAVNGEPRWITCPVRRMPLGTAIRLAEIDDSQAWRVKFIRTLEANYRRERGFASAMDLLEPLVRSGSPQLSEFNIAVVQAIAAHLGVKATFVRQSELEVSGHATELLISIVKAVGGTTYLYGGGAAGYQDDALIERSGLELRAQSFAPVAYGPPETFIPGLSVIDYLMRDGRKLGA
ncbi:WbqC family protein [uncultured Alsobacter sp.]|uniref:WbqC family protein n=1 Tax=uncultured Alsobacter sp. TaxID=1748258 RepID=UPI0025CB8CA4|nr:WbqC family protein [uncultured Alsobacter sp.]